VRIRTKRVGSAAVVMVGRGEGKPALARITPSS
jgi:hypothetical protein